MSLFTKGFPYTNPLGSQANMFIQWKGTDICLDFTCECGFSGHIDDSFTYFIECSECGTVYEMGTQVIARKVDRDKLEGRTQPILLEE